MLAHTHTLGTLATQIWADIALRQLGTLATQNYGHACPTYILGMFATQIWADLDPRQLGMLATQNLGRLAPSQLGTLVTQILADFPQTT